MKTALIIILSLMQVYAYGQTSGDTTDYSIPIGEVNIDSLEFEVDYGEVNWLYTDTIEIDFNQLTNTEIFESGVHYTADIDFSNSSGKTIKIFKTSTSCSCLLSDIPSVAISPNDDFSIRFKYSPLSPGEQEEIINIYIYDEQLYKPIAIMPLKLVFKVELNTNE